MGPDWVDKTCPYFGLGATEAIFTTCLSSNLGPRSTIEKRRQPLKNLGMVLLSIWLIVTGLLTFVTVSIPSSGIVLALLAIAAGVLFLLDMREKRLSGNIGIILLSIWLILAGLLPLLSVTVHYSDFALAILSVVSGILLLIRR